MGFFRKDTKKKIERKIYSLNSNEECVVKIGSSKLVLAHRHEYLDYYGNPVYTITYLDKDNKIKESVTSNGPVVSFLESKLTKKVLNNEKSINKLSKKYKR